MWWEQDHASPINFDPDKVEEDNDLITLKFINFGKSVSSIVKNSSNSIEFIPNTKNAKFINHRGMYMVQQFHFHWREEAGEGSRHCIDGSQFVLTLYTAPMCVTIELHGYHSNRIKKQFDLLCTIPITFFSHVDMQVN